MRKYLGFPEEPTVFGYASVRGCLFRALVGITCSDPLAPRLYGSIGRKRAPTASIDGR